MSGRGEGPRMLSTLSNIAAGIKSSNEARCSLLYTNTLKVSSIAQEIKETPKKQQELETKSEGYRHEGNTFFKKAMYMHAYQMYTRSVACALRGPVCALAYGNRSASLFYMARLKECLLDIDRAISNGYQENLLYKLYLRQARCLKYLKKDYSLSLKNSIEALEIHNKGEMEALKGVVASEMKQPSPVPMSKSGEYFHGGEIPPLSYGASEEVPCFSSAISVVYSKELGRHLVANRNIEIGDALIIENPIAAVVDMDKTNKVCCKCFKISYTLNPCDICRQFMYCSEACKKMDWDDGHKDECELVNQVLALAINLHPHQVFFGYKKDKFTIPCLVLSMMTHVLGLEKMKEAVVKNGHLGSSHHDPRTRGFNKEGKFTFSLEALLSLTDNFDKLKQIEVFAIVNYATQGVMHTPCWSEKLDDLTVLYLKLYLIAVFNYKPITIFCNLPRVSIKDRAEWCSSEIGFGLYLASSLINHSCDPNMQKVNYGKTVVYVAKRFIKKGEMLTESLYLNYLGEKLNERQRVLYEHYRFTCKCEACFNKWSTAEIQTAALRNPRIMSEMLCILLENFTDGKMSMLEIMTPMNLMVMPFPLDNDSLPPMISFLKKLYSKGKNERNCLIINALQGCVMLNYSARGSNLLSRFASSIISGRRKFLFIEPEVNYSEGFLLHALADPVPLETKI